MAEMSASVAQSNVDVIDWCLNTPPDEHRMECEEEWAGEVLGLGEHPGVYHGAAAMDPVLPLVMAMQALAFRLDDSGRSPEDG